MVVYKSASEYIQTCKSLRDKIVAIEAITQALLLVAVKAAESDNISEYGLNDGQTQIKTIYKGASSVYTSIASFEKLKNLYVNQLVGRKVKLVDGKNFTGGY